jgi:hypothetical protein
MLLLLLLLLLMLLPLLRLPLLLPTWLLLPLKQIIIPACCCSTITFHVTTAISIRTLLTHILLAYLHLALAMAVARDAVVLVEYADIIDNITHLEDVLSHLANNSPNISFEAIQAERLLDQYYIRLSELLEAYPWLHEEGEPDDTPFDPTDYGHGE